MKTISYHVRRSAAAAAFVVTISLFSGRPAVAVEEEAARALVQAAVADMLGAFAGRTLTPDEAQVAMQGVVAKYCDMEIESKLVLGRYWTTATPAQQKEFKSLLESFFVTMVGGLIDKVPADQHIAVQGSERDGDRVVVNSLAYVRHEQGTPVHWVVMDGTSGRPVITDVSTEGADLITTLQADFTSVVRRAAGRVGALFEPMRRKIAGFSTTSGDRPPRE